MEVDWGEEDDGRGNGLCEVLLEIFEIGAGKEECIVSERKEVASTDLRTGS
jgi:hypothetical protein